MARLIMEVLAKCGESFVNNYNYKNLNYYYYYFYKQKYFKNYFFRKLDFK